ncbi:hypothetical protein AJ80_03897 [Polytolypa hystricis UAMH7299]|uniref:Uncharacterized protein n=1 Tax=Polytolypa hystricis (strain UAMH7299) TaxID=1447883 RepID=A0A2B7YET2_POLH7|nr:hypothetical protein AJ80_03897 [Polytolypa hystricis UAMH7299]
MFSIILPSRPCLTNPLPIQQDPNSPATNFAFTFPAFPKFSHIVVFLLPGVTLPLDTAAAVYIQFPNPNPNGTTTTGSIGPNPSEFRFLGAIGNEKPSAIFKVTIPTRHRTEAEEEDEMMDEGAMGSGTTTPAISDPNAMITLGIAIEPIQSVATKLASLPASQPSSTTDLVRAGGSQPASAFQGRQAAAPQVSTKVLAQRIIGNAFNFLASFAAADPRAQGEEVVPLKSFRDWWAKFERRIDADPGFLEREGGGY